MTLSCGVLFSVTELILNYPCSTLIPRPVDLDDIVLLRLRAIESSPCQVHSFVSSHGNDNGTVSAAAAAKGEGAREEVATLEDDCTPVWMYLQRLMHLCVVVM